MVDAFYGALKTRSNTQPVSISAVSPVLTASDVNIGAFGYPDVLAALDMDMDLFELITMQNDIFAAGNEDHHQWSSNTPRQPTASFEGRSTSALALPVLTSTVMMWEEYF